MEEYTLNIEYRERNSKEILNKEIYVDLKKYRESYEEDALHLQKQYTEKQVENEIQPLKKEFLTDLINKNLNNNAKLYNPDIDSLIDELDDYISDMDSEVNDYVSEDDEY